MTERNLQIIYAAAPGLTPDQPLSLIVGIPDAAWQYMQDGHTHMLDLTEQGIPLKILTFAAKNAEQAEGVITKFRESCCPPREPEEKVN